MNSEKTWNVVATPQSMASTNPIRAIVDRIKIPANPPRPVIPLSIGDPTKFGNLPPPEGLVEKLSELAASGATNGYQVKSISVLCLLDVFLL